MISWKLFKINKKIIMKLISQKKKKKYMIDGNIKSNSKYYRFTRST